MTSAAAEWAYQSHSTATNIPRARLSALGLVEDDEDVATGIVAGSLADDGLVASLAGTGAGLTRDRHGDGDDRALAVIPVLPAHSDRRRTAIS